MKYHSEAGDHRRPVGIRMADDVDSIVPMALVRHADRGPGAVGLSLPASQRTARVAELRRQVAHGVYASTSMMDALARRILVSGDL
jgi:hypothetical protein